MSQIFFDTSSSPSVPTSFVTDDGTATPAANVLNVLGINGITTSGSGNTVNIALDNACEVTGQTVGAVTDSITCIDLGSTAGTYSFDINVAGYCTAGTDAGGGVGYFIRGAARTDGASATIIGTPDQGVWEDAALVGAVVAIGTSGNNLVIEVTGVAGDTINWTALTKGTFVS